MSAAAARGADALAAEVLRQNWSVGEHDGVHYSYTRPSPLRYPWQWYWDSCFAAIVWRHFDRARSRAELESLLAAQRPNGFIGHTIFWHRPVSGWRRLFYNVRDRSALTTETIQPPLLAWAWRIAVGDPAAEPRIGAHADWLAANRDLEGDGLLWIVQGDESGLDASPKFDPVWGRRAPSQIGFPLLVRRNRRLDWNARAVLDAGGPVLCEVVVNVLWSLSLIALGRPSATPALVERLWDEPSGLFLDETLPGGLRPGVETVAALAPLALPDLPEAIGRRLVEEHVLDRRALLARLSAAVGRRHGALVRSPGAGAARCAATGAARPGSTPRGWSGSGSSGSATTSRRGSSRRACAGLIEREGLREYYDPHTGAGLGAKDFAWTSLAVELADPRRAAEVMPDAER